MGGRSRLAIIPAAALALAAFLLLTTIHHVGRSGRGGGERGVLTAREYREMLGVGLAVDWLNYPRVSRWYFYWRSRGFSFAWMVREEGFSHVRIRVSGDVVTNRTLLHQLRVVVEDCLKAGLIPVVAYTAPELRSGNLTPAAQRHFVEWWVTVARELRDLPYTVSYDLILETSGALKDKPELLNRLYNETIEAIRRIDPYRIIIVTPPNTSSPWSLDSLKVRFDRYTMVEWHIYAGGPKPVDGRPYSIALIEAAVGKALEWSRRTGVPVYMGAWRPNRLPKHHRQRLPDGSPKGLLAEPVAEAFAATMEWELCSHHIPNTVNADTLFIDYTNHRWYPTKKQLADLIVETCRNAWGER